MNDLIIRPVEPLEYDKWDLFVRKSGTGTLFHTSIWKSVIDAAYSDGEYTLIGAFDKEQLIGGFCALKRNRLGIVTAVTPLSTPHTGFVLSGQGSKAPPRDSELYKAFAAYLRHYRFQNIQCAVGLADPHPLVAAGYKIIPRYTLELDLQQPEEKLWTALDGSVRRNIKKAAKSGFEISSQWDNNRAYEIFRETFARHGKRCPVAEKLFQGIADGSTLSRYRRRYCAWRNGRLEAFVVALRYNEIVYYELVGTGTASLKSGISSLLIWEMIKDHLDGNWNVFDFVGANDPSISRFKSKFGPVSRTYFAAEYCSSRRIAVARKVQELLRRQ